MVDEVAHLARDGVEQGRAGGRRGRRGAVVEGERLGGLVENHAEEGWGVRVGA